MADEERPDMTGSNPEDAEIGGTEDGGAASGGDDPAEPGGDAAGGGRVESPEELEALIASAGADAEAEAAREQADASPEPGAEAASSDSNRGNDADLEAGSEPAAGGEAVAGSVGGSSPEGDSGQSEDALAALKAVQDAIKMASGEADASSVTDEDQAKAERAAGSAAALNDEASAAASAGASGPALRGEQERPLPPGVEPEAFMPPAFDAPVTGEVPREIKLLRDVQLNVEIELGRTRMLVEDVLRLGDGSVVELDKLAGDPVDVFVNGCLIARGEVLVLNDNFCVRINEVIGNPAAAATRAG